jgi:Ca2+-binding RTX toxin-like protein
LFLFYLVFGINADGQAISVCMGFSDGTSVDLTDIDTPAAGTGQHVLERSSGGSRIIGSASDGTLIGASLDDVLVGGAGDDTLFGDAGDDSYEFARGNGQDLIDNIGEGTSNDKIVFSPGINTDQLWFSQTGDDLLVSIIGTNDQVIVDDWYLNAGANQVARFEVSNGSNLTAANVENLVSAMDAFAPPALGELEFTQTLHDNLDPFIAANWQ